MTSSARRSVPLLLAGAVGAALALTACTSAGPAAPTSPRPALAPTVAIPGAARQVTLSMKYGANANGRKPPSPVTVTDSAKVGEVAWLVDHLPPWPPGTYNCPPGDGTALILAFRAHLGGPLLATADLDLNGCEGTDVTVGGKDYFMGEPGSARRFAVKVLAAAGVPWKLPPFSWPPT
jgi:hypothetical protein